MQHKFMQQRDGPDSIKYFYHANNNASRFGSSVVLLNKIFELKLHRKMFIGCKYHAYLTPFVSGTGLECYYCYRHAGTERDECDVDIFGETVECQMQDPKLPHFGDVCSVGHTG